MISLPDQQQPSDVEATTAGCEAGLCPSAEAGLCPSEDVGDGVPIWVPDPSDPHGLEGTWMLVDPAAPNVDPKKAAQANAIAKLWATAQRWAAA